MRVDEIVTIDAGGVEVADDELGLRLHILTSLAEEVVVTVNEDEHTTAVKLFADNNSPMSIGDLEIMNTRKTISPGEIFTVPVRWIIYRIVL